ncbi:MAG: hypothetical protein WB441_06805 [Nocardioidaceae bacterium]
MQHPRRLTGVGALAALGLLLSPTAALAHGGGDDLVDADLVPSMPADQAIDHVKPGAAPWILGDGKVRVRADGRMDVEIEGLQIPDFQGLGDRNPVTSIRAVLHCGGTAAGDSGPRPMSDPAGDAKLRVWLSVPRQCAKATVLIKPAGADVYIASAVAGDRD